MNISHKLEKLMHPDLINGSIIKSLIAFLIPLLISYTFQQCYSAADAVIVGHYLHEESLAAIGAAAVLFELLIGFGMGFGNGLGIVVARAFGANREDILKKCVSAAFVITVIITLLIMIAGKFFLMPLLNILGTPKEIILESYSYINTIAVFCGVLFAYNLFSALLRAIGNSFMPLIFLIISSLLNISLDIIFITKFGMGVKGTAIATVIAQGISALLCFIYIFTKAKILIPSKIHFKPEVLIYRDMLGQGLSMAFMGSIVTSGTVIIQSAINSFGKFIIAGHIAARKIFTMTTIPIFTLGMTASTFASQNYGAGKYDRIRKGVKDAILIITGWTILLILVFPFVLKFLMIFISGSQNPKVLNYGVKYVQFMLPFYIALGGVIVIRNALQGLGSKLLPLISSIIEMLGKILFTIVIIPKMGTRGIIICEPLIWCAMCIQLVYTYLRNPAISRKNKS